MPRCPISMYLNTLLHCAPRLPCAYASLLELQLASIDWCLSVCFSVSLCGDCRELSDNTNSRIWCACCMFDSRVTCKSTNCKVKRSVSCLYVALPLNRAGHLHQSISTTRWRDRWVTMLDQGVFRLVGEKGIETMHTRSVCPTVKQQLQHNATAWDDHMAQSNHHWDRENRQTTHRSCRYHTCQCGGHALCHANSNYTPQISATHLALEAIP